MSRIERPNQVAFIQLKGEPYQREVEHDGGVVFVDSNLTFDDLAMNSGYVDGLSKKVESVSDHLIPLYEGGGYYGLDAKLKHGQNLTFEEAFSLIAFVVSALNRPLLNLLVDRIQNLGPRDTHTLQAVALLSSMSTKEGFSRLTPQEIAGMVAATIHLDTVVRTSSSDNVLAYGGMGGDKGYPRNGDNSKLFSLSTLSSIASAILGPTHKHHSYPNTSKVAGQSAIEAFGARSDFHSLQAFDRVLAETNLIMSSCHNTRTLHTLSHLLRGETINHVIGPLAFTMSKESNLHAFVGVNEKIHPETVIEALGILRRKGYQAYDNSAVYCGTDLKTIKTAMLNPTEYYVSGEAKEHIRLDEIAPPPFVSLVAFSKNGASAGTYVLHPEDFYTEVELEKMNFRQLLIPNRKEEILYFNREAITGRDEAKSRYLAMTIGLGIFVREYLGRSNSLSSHTHRVNHSFLRRATSQAYDLLKSGQAERKLEDYVLSTQRHAGAK
jgi:anthranilate phosphoribosyltransferase